MKNLTLTDIIVRAAIAAIVLGIAFTGYLKATGKF
jgi:hypothetical protein